MTYGHALSQEPLPRGHEIYNFGRLFLCYYYYALSSSAPCHGVEKIFFLIYPFYTLYPKNTDVMKCKISCL